MGLTPLYYPNYQAEYKMYQQQNTTNRKRSFKRRRLMENVISISVIAIIFILTQNIEKTQAVPMVSGYMRLHKDVGTQIWQHHRHQRFIRDVGAPPMTAASLQHQQQKENLKESLLQQSSSTEVSLEQPQGQCLLDGEYVPETTVFCEKQVGCRAIQKTGHCCPDYKCDCQKDGKTYLNGDKLVDPETPCTVCYCQGGEILCSSVTCFHRDDCTPKYIPGVCCPQYDNCPVATSESSVNKTLALTSTTIKPEMPQAGNNPKITIKEITKPTEIRITDDNKAIPIHQMLKPSTSTTSTTTTTETPTTTSTTTTTTTPQPSTTTATSTTTPNTPTTVNAIKSSTNHNENNNNADTKESFETFSVDNNHHSQNGIAIGKPGVINSGDILKLSASVAYPSTVVAAVISSTITPIMDSSIEVEDPVPALSVFSTQGLPEDPSKVNIKREYFITTEGVNSGLYDGLGSGEFPNSELIYGQSSPVQTFNTGLQQTSAELDPDTAGSDNIYHIILTTDGPRVSSTSENYLALKGVSTTEGSPFDDLSPSSSVIPIDSNDNLDSSKVMEASTTEGPLKPEEFYAKSTTETAVHQHLDDEDSAIESNPAYPSLPEDDFSLRDNNYQINESDDVGDEPRSIGSHGVVGTANDAFKSTKHLEDASYGSGSGSGSGMLVEELLDMPSSTTEGSGDLMLSSTESYQKLKTPQLQPMYSAEDLSEETRITNSTDFKMVEKKTEDFHKTMTIDNTSLESSETKTQLEALMSAEFGSGSGEIKADKREPTTPRPNKKSSEIDIDEVHDASGNGPEDDPKLDVESLKFDETQEDSLSNPDKSPKNNILSVKVQPAQEKQFFEGLH